MNRISETLHSILPTTNMKRGAIVLTPIAIGVLYFLFKKPKPEEPRYYLNNHPDYTGKLSEINVEKVQATIRIIEKEITTIYPADLSAPGQFSLPNIYLGTGGIAYCWWRRYINDPTNKAALTKANEYLQATEKLFKNEPPPNDLISIVSSIPGFYMTACLINHSLGNQQAADDYYAKFASKSACALEFSKENDWLFGGVGYLNGCQILAANANRGGELAEKVADNMVQCAIKTWEDSYKNTENKPRLASLFLSSKLKPFVSYLANWDPSPWKRIITRVMIKLMLWYSPKGKEYYGLGHGTCSTLYFALNSQKQIQQNGAILKQTAEHFYQLHETHKNWPVFIGDNKPTTLVHWCHGAPSYLFVLGKASVVFSEQKYLKCAEEAGEEIWTKGILKKGGGICHGIAGNGYALLYLYKITNNKKWLHRAEQFAVHICDNYPNLRKADNACSLFEGSAGTLLFLEDILRARNNPATAKFPVFEDHN